MKKLLILLILLFLSACEPDPTVKPGYIVDELRPLGFKVEPVEAVPGDIVAMSLLIGGRTFSQDSNMKILWMGSEELSLPYTKPFILPLPENLDEMVPNDNNDPQISLFIDNFNKNGFADLPIIASFEIPVPDENRNRTITATKTIRIYKKIPDEGVKNNPIIDHVVVSFEKADKKEEFEIRNKEKLSLPLKDMPETFIFRSIPVKKEETGWDRLNFSWLFTSDTGELLENDMEIELNRKKYGDMVPKDQKATQNREYFALSFKAVLEEIKEEKIKLPLIFNFYHIIRDKAVSAESSSDYRWGQDFIWFEIEITEEK